MRLPLRTRFQIDRIAAGVAREGTVLEIEGTRRDTVEQVAIVGDEEQRAAKPLGEMHLEPLDRGHIQMVGGLVQNRDVRLTDEHPSQGNAPLLSARQRLDRTLRVGDPEMLDDGLGLVVSVPTAEMLERLGSVRLELGQA